MNFAQAVFRRLCWLFKILIIGCHVRLNVKPATLLKYLGCNCICIAYLTVWFMYVLVVVNLFFLNSISCPVFLRRFAAADCSDGPWRRCQILEIWFQLPYMSGPHTLCHIISILKQLAQPSPDNLGQVHRPLTGLFRTPSSTRAGQGYTDRKAEHQVTSSTL